MIPPRPPTSVIFQPAFLSIVTVWVTVVVTPSGGLTSAIEGTVIDLTLHPDHVSMRFTVTDCVPMGSEAALSVPRTRAPRGLIAEKS